MRSVLILHDGSRMPEQAMDNMGTEDLALPFLKSLVG